MTATTLNGIDAVRAAVGTHLGYSDWVTIEQERVNKFAEATGDFQWIHIGQERAAKGPFGGTIAHGYLTLSLLPRFFQLALDVRQKGMGVNYGLNKVRFTAPVPVGSRLRARMTLLQAKPIDNQGMQMTWSVAVEREGSDKPVCVAESLARHYP